jgi:hypothetical protein
MGEMINFSAANAAVDDLQDMVKRKPKPVSKEPTPNLF